MVEIKCPRGHVHEATRPEDGDVIDCPNPDCDNREVWSEGKEQGFKIV